jgi:glutaredoxin
MNTLQAARASAPDTSKPQATIYRMVMPAHTCPFGLKAIHLLKSHGFAVDDHWLKTRAETDDFKTEHGVKTTPQIFIDGQRIGGYDDLRRHFGKTVPDAGALTYRPIVTVLVVSALMAAAATYAAKHTIFDFSGFESFIAFAMCILAILKIQDTERFSTMFLNYDLLARRWVPYGYIYPYAELTAGVLMISGLLSWLSAPIALFIGTIGAISVIKAVYVDKRSLKCACVGGGTNVPLGFVSLTENLMMILMGAITLANLAGWR